MTLDECKLMTQEHIAKVRKYIRFFTDRLTTKGEKHDASKLGEIEAPLFAEHIENLSKIEFGTEEYKKLNSSTEIDINHNLLKEISFSVKMGEFIAILGPTGSGKTCLFLHLISFLNPTI